MATNDPLDKVVSGNKTQILGEAVFGTMQGLFAIGSGVLDGIQNSPHVFELRNSDRNLDFVPDEDCPILFRMAVHATGGQPYDLVGIAGYANDVDKRRGFIGRCAAVEYGDIDAYRKAYDLVYQKIAETVNHYIVDGNFRRVPEHIAFSGERISHFSRYEYTRVDEVPPIVLTMHGWLEPDRLPIVLDALEAAVWYGGRAAPRVIIVGNLRNGASQISPELIDKYNAAANRRREEEGRHSLQGGAASKNRPHSLGESVVDKKLRSLEARVQELESKVDDIESEIWKSSGRRSKNWYKLIDKNWTVALVSVGLFALIAISILLVALAR